MINDIFVCVAHSWQMQQSTNSNEIKIYRKKNKSIRLEAYRELRSNWAQFRLIKTEFVCWLAGDNVGIIWCCAKEENCWLHGFYFFLFARSLYLSILDATQIRLFQWHQSIKRLIFRVSILRNFLFGFNFLFCKYRGEKSGKIIQLHGRYIELALCSMPNVDVFKSLLPTIAQCKRLSVVSV